MIRQKDASIAKFNLNRIADKSFGLEWEYLDPGYDFSFHIMYIGNEVPKFNLSGIILDISKFDKFKQSPNEDRRFSIAFVVAYSLLFIFIVGKF